MPVISLVERIDALLPQTQCGQCSHAGCRPYAEALAEGRDPINRCPPGGEDGIRRLAALTGRAWLPFDPAGPQPKPRARAVIDEDNCIGCTLCIQACPVDAILGASKHMHTVVRDECTGCELCVAPCPVDAIHMLELDPATEAPTPARTDLARQRHLFRLERQARERDEKARRQAERTAENAPGTPTAANATAAVNTLDDQKRAVIEAAMRRAAEKQAARKAEDSRG